MINLFQNYYDEKSKDRKQEILFCIKKNMENKLINYVLIESNNRMTYTDYFKIINNYTKQNDINIIANLDIYFNDTLKLLDNMKNNEAYALCRWDLKNNGEIQFANRPDSQDAWIFRGPINGIFGDFNLGWLGCDNRILYEINKAGYKVSNPSISIQTIHYHVSNIRNYTVKGSQRSQNEVKGPYLTMAPSKL